MIRREHVDFEGTTIFKYEAQKVHLYDDRNPGKAPTSFQADSRRSFLAIVEERPENHRLMELKRFLGALWLLRLDPRQMTAITKKEARWLERDGANLASWFQRFPAEEPEAVDALQADMREILGGLKYFRLPSAGGPAKELVATLAVGVPPKPYDISFEELSLGQRELFALYAILHLVARKATVLCLDEPDNFLALREIQPWLIKLSDAIEESGGQLLLISHHPEAIDYLAAADAFIVERPGGDVARVRPLLVDRNAGLKASEMLARGWVDVPSQD
jgi:predicted ATPase